MKKGITLINVLLFQLFSSLLLVYEYFINFFKVPSFIILTVVIFTSLACIWLLYKMINLQKAEEEAKLANLKLGESEKLVRTLSAEHHDFINHLQVISFFNQLNRKEKCDAYIKNLSKDLIEIDKLIALERPELAALICTKVLDISYIKPIFEIESKLSNLSIPYIKLNKILESIMDTAIDEMSSNDEKWLQIKILEDELNYIFEFTNPGSSVDDKSAEGLPENDSCVLDDDVDNLFMARRLIHEVNGTFSYDKNSLTTTYRLQFPKQAC